MKREQHKIQALIEDWQAKLGLQDWDIRYSPDDASPDDRGSSDIWDNKRSAVVRIDKTCPHDVVEEIVIHELLHILLHPLIDPLNEVLQRHLAPSLHAEIRIAAKQAEEVAIHHLTVLLTGHGVQCWPEGEKHTPLWATAFPVAAQCP